MTQTEPQFELLHSTVALPYLRNVYLSINVNQKQAVSEALKMIMVYLSL